MTMEMIPEELTPASPADLRIAVAEALRQAGCNSFADLEAQARSGHFASTRARMAWVAIGNLGKYSG